MKHDRRWQKIEDWIGQISDTAKAAEIEEYKSKSVMLKKSCINS